MPPNHAIIIPWLNSKTKKKKKKTLKSLKLY